MGQLVSAATKAVAAEVRATRNRRQLPQQRVYKAAEMSKSAYGRFERGERGIHLDKLEAICRELGVTLYELVVAAEREHPQAFTPPRQRGPRNT